MIKILHFADLHLGMENYGKIDAKTGLSSRFLDFLKCFDQLVKYAIEEKVDLVLFCGDAYKSRDPTPTLQREFAKRIYKIATAGIPIVLLIGNHDLPTSAGKADTLEIFPTLKIKNVYVSNKIEVLEIPLLREHSKIQIVTLPWIAKTHFLSHDERFKTSQQFNQKICQKIQLKLKELFQKLKPEFPALLAAHATMEGATYGSEQQVTLGTDIVLPKEIFKNKALQYIALGHLHKKQILNTEPPIIYAGSIERVDFGEEKEDKGFFLVEINPQKLQKANFQFIKLPARKFITIEIQISKDDTNPTLTVVNEVKKRQTKDVVVRVIINLNQEQFNLIRQSEIQEALKDAFFIAQISKEVKKEKIEKILYSDDIATLSPLQWVEKYLQVKKEKKSKIKKLLFEAEHLLEELR